MASVDGHPGEISDQTARITQQPMWGYVKQCAICLCSMCCPCLTCVFQQLSNPTVMEYISSSTNPPAEGDTTIREQIQRIGLAAAGHDGGQAPPTLPFLRMCPVYRRPTDTTPAGSAEEELSWAVLRGHPMTGTGQ